MEEDSSRQRRMKSIIARREREDFICMLETSQVNFSIFSVSAHFSILYQFSYVYFVIVELDLVPISLFFT